MFMLLYVCLKATTLLYFAIVYSHCYQLLVTSESWDFRTLCETMLMFKCSTATHSNTTLDAPSGWVIPDSSNPKCQHRWYWDREFSLTTIPRDLKFLTAAVIPWFPGSMHRVMAWFFHEQPRICFPKLSKTYDIFLSVHFLTISTSRSKIQIPPCYAYLHIALIASLQTSCASKAENFLTTSPTFQEGALQTASLLQTQKGSKWQWCSGANGGHGWQHNIF